MSALVCATVAEIEERARKEYADHVARTSTWEGQSIATRNAWLRRAAELIEDEHGPEPRHAIDRVVKSFERTKYVSNNDRDDIAKIRAWLESEEPR